MDDLYRERQCFRCHGTGQAKSPRLDVCPICSGTGVEVVPCYQSSKEEATRAALAAWRREIELGAEY